MVDRFPDFSPAVLRRRDPPSQKRKSMARMEILEFKTTHPAGLAVAPIRALGRPSGPGCSSDSGRKKLSELDCPPLFSPDEEERGGIHPERMTEDLAILWR